MHAEELSCISTSTYSQAGELVVQAVASASEADAPDPKLRDHMIDMLSTHFLVGPFRPCVVMELPSPL